MKKSIKDKIYNDYYKNFLSKAKLSKKYCISKKRLYNLFKKYNWKSLPLRIIYKNNNDKKLYLDGIKIKRLYLIKKLSTPQIAKIFNCSIIPIIGYLKLMNVKIRNRTECQKGLHDGNKNPAYKTGKPHCLDCGKRLTTYIAKRCKDCFDKHNSFTNHYNWKGGISKLPYSFDFTPKLKQQIRERDNFICQCCGLDEKDHFKGKQRVDLTIHHIDYNKQNCKEDNLITVCLTCNSTANGNKELDRDYWFAYFKYVMDNKIVR